MIFLIFYYLLISGKDNIWSLNLYNLNFKKMKSPPFSCYLSFIKSSEIFICVGRTHEYIDIVYLHAIYFISPSNLFDVVYEIKNKYGCFYNIKYINMCMLVLNLFNILAKHFIIRVHMLRKKNFQSYIETSLTTHCNIWSVQKGWSIYGIRKVQF